GSILRRGRDQGWATFNSRNPPNNGEYWLRSRPKSAPTGAQEHARLSRRGAKPSGLELPCASGDETGSLGAVGAAMSCTIEGGTIRARVGCGCSSASGARTVLFNGGPAGGAGRGSGRHEG